MTSCRHMSIVAPCLSMWLSYPADAEHVMPCFRFTVTFRSRCLACKLFAGNCNPLNLLFLVGVISMKWSRGGSWFPKKKYIYIYIPGKGRYYIRVLIACCVCRYRLVSEHLKLTKALICWDWELLFSGILCVHQCIGTTRMLHMMHILTQVEYLVRPEIAAYACLSSRWWFCLGNCSVVLGKAITLCLCVAAHLWLYHVLLFVH